MSEKPKVDWDLGLSLFVQKLTYPQIAKRIGVSHDCVRQHAYRHSWPRLRTETTPEASLAPKEGESKPKGPTLVERSNQVRVALATDLARSVERLSRIPHSSCVSGYTKRAKAVDVVASTARTVFGWGTEDDSRPMVRIGVLNLATLRDPTLPPGVRVAPATLPFTNESQEAPEPVVEAEVSSPSPPPTEPPPAA